MRLKARFTTGCFVMVLVQLSYLILVWDRELQDQSRKIRTIANISGELSDHRFLLQSNTSHGTIRLYSALVSNSTTHSSWDVITLQGWGTGINSNDKFTCCVQHSSGTVIQYRNVVTQPWVGFKNATLVAWQFRCYLSSNTAVDLPSMVTLSSTSDSCPAGIERFVGAEFVYKPTGKIAVYAKVLYSHLSPDDLLVWFEIHKILGIDTVLVHVTDSLNVKARTVLNYYQHQGLAQILHYPLPGKVSVMDEDSPQCWNFKGVSAFDGSERLMGYDYVVSMDPDEYLVPTLNETLASVFDRLMTSNPDAAGFLFKTFLFIKSWSPKQESAYTVEHHVFRSDPTEDRIKHVTVPHRLRPGGMRPHHFFPSTGYQTYFAPVQDIAIYHYRVCRESWVSEQQNISCYDMRRTRDDIVLNLFRTVQANVYRLKQQLRID